MIQDHLEEDRANVEETWANEEEQHHQQQPLDQVENSRRPSRFIQFERNINLVSSRA